MKGKGFKRAGFEFISILVAVVLAMALTEWRQEVLNEKAAQESFKNILGEIQVNLNDLSGDSTELAERIRNLEQWVDTDQEFRDTVHLSLGFGFSFLNKAVWQVAQLNQSLTHLDSEVVTDLSDAYLVQEFYQKQGERAFHALGQTTKIRRDDNDQRYAESVKELLFELNLTRNAMNAYLATSREVLSVYGSEEVEQ